MLENNPTLTSAEGFYGPSDIKARNVQFHQKARFSFDVIIVIFRLVLKICPDCLRFNWASLSVSFYGRLDHKSMYNFWTTIGHI